ncbi:hypothetical protein TeGR_g1057 [Tetraparma gracilis]|uniref:mitogen-activated protein kinase kinase n=1 Tax=Tetraparma gracilis TaxID=2962635 RepID=A0ABQ6N8P1_9STRA|nr:hypothetical protein TeGR_g1057 [Tetraparma gracilis]
MASPPPPSLSAWFQMLRIPAPLSDQYEVSLQGLGYDDIQSVAAWLARREALSGEATLALVHSLGVTGARLLDGDAAALALALGVTFGPHRRLLERELADLRAKAGRLGELAASPTAAGGGGKRHTLRAAAASVLRKLGGSQEGISPTGISPTGISPTGISPTGISPTGISPTSAAAAAKAASPSADLEDELSVASGLSDGTAARRLRAREAARSPGRRQSAMAAGGGFRPPPMLDLGGAPSLSVGADAGEEGEREAGRSFEFSDGGTLNINGWNIGTRGISNVPKEEAGMAAITEEGGTPVATPSTTRTANTGPTPRGASAGTPGARPAPRPAPRPSSGPRSPRHVRSELVLLKEVGRGACGIVHEALHVPTMKLVAVKSVAVNDGEKRRQMIKELAAMHGMCARDIGGGGEGGEGGEPIVSFYDAYTDPAKGTVCMVLEYMNAGTLQDLVAAKIDVTERMLASVALSVLSGLAEVHASKQIHRDIKPSNILLDRDGGIKISDFGIARKLEHSVSMASTFTGTLTYMSPERISGQEYSYPSDIWSLGVCLATLALGRYPYPTQSGYWGVVQAIQDSPCPDVAQARGYGRELQAFIASCLAKDPALRPTAKELLGSAFLDKYRGEPLATGASPETSSKKVAALKSLARTVVGYHVERCKPGGGGGDLAKALESMGGGGLEKLSGQLGMPRDVVEDVFEKEAAKARPRSGSAGLGAVKVKGGRGAEGFLRRSRSGSGGSFGGGASSPESEGWEGPGSGGGTKGRYIQMALGGGATG